MIKKLSMLLLVVAITTSTVAQDGQGRGNRMGGGDGRGFQRMTVEERVAQVHARFDSVFKFDATKQAKVDSAFKEAFKAQEKMREEMRANFTPGQQPDPSVREKMQEKMKEVQVARDEKLQEILTEAEYKKFKDEVEPAMRPNRGNGQGGFGGRDGERKDGEKKDEVKKEEKKDGEKKEGEEKKEKKKKKKEKKEEVVITTTAQ